MELQKQLVESPDKLDVFIMCPGLSKEEVVISFDKKDGYLEIQGIPSKSTLSESVELGVKGKITITPKYRSEEITAVVEDGILTITFGLAKDVNLISVK